MSKKWGIVIAGIASVFAVAAAFWNWVVSNLPRYKVMTELISEQVSPDGSLSARVYSADVNATTPGFMVVILVPKNGRAMLWILPTEFLTSAIWAG